MGTDGVGQIIQGTLVKTLAGLFETGLHLRDGEKHRSALLGLERGVAQQSAKTLAKAPVFISCQSISPFRFR